MSEQERRRYAELETGHAPDGLSAAEFQNVEVASAADHERVLVHADGEDSMSGPKMRRSQDGTNAAPMAASASFAREACAFENASDSNDMSVATLIAVIGASIICILGYSIWYAPIHAVATNAR